MTERAVTLALGSNLGDRAGNLRAGLSLLRDRGIVIDKASSVWETPPVPADQPPFYNAVVTGTTELEPLDLLRTVKEVEHLVGRRPGPKWGPRPLDVDILFLGDEYFTSPELAIPHPLLAERAFVLVPLSEVIPGELPLLGRRALDFLADLPPEQLVRTGEALT